MAISVVGEVPDRGLPRTARQIPQGRPTVESDSARPARHALPLGSLPARHLQVRLAALPGVPHGPDRGPDLGHQDGPQATGDDRADQLDSLQPLSSLSAALAAASASMTFAVVALVSACRRAVFGSQPGSQAWPQTWAIR